MVMLIRILRPVAYLLGLAGIFLILRGSDESMKRIGWALIIAMVPFFIAISILTSVQLARQKASRRRRR
jgi:4-hydroxybenzoate polyprenyltransferase